jgi:hypothetical protein
MDTHEQISLLIYIKNMLADLIFINSIIATELIKVAENSAAISHENSFLISSSCIEEHTELSKKIIEIVKKYKSKHDDYSCLEPHILKHP